MGADNNSKEEGLNMYYSRPTKLLWKGLETHSPFTKYEVVEVESTSGGKSYEVNYQNYNEVTLEDEPIVEPAKKATGFKDIEEAKNWAQGNFEKKLNRWLCDVNEEDKLEHCVQTLIDSCHSRAAANGWWSDLETGKPKDRNVLEMCMLVVTEVSEAVEGYRKGLKDDHLPHLNMFDVELADVLVRVFDMAGGLKTELARAFVEKLAYNDNREDHKIENRKKAGGKKY